MSSTAVDQEGRDVDGSEQTGAGADDGQEGALAGVRVLDFSRVLVGPFCAQILGDLGAEVIKVEAPGGDVVRQYDGSVGTQFASFNRNKQSIVVDLKTSEGREVIRRLVRSADVLLHNFRGGVAERIGLGYDELCRENPRLVYCSITGFGTVGPMAEQPAADLIAQAYSGLLSYTGEPGREPVRVPIAVGDLSTALYAAVGIVAALAWRERTGRGQKIETSLLESLLSLETNYLTRYLVRGLPARPMGNENVGMGLPNQAFRVKDGMVAITAVNNEMWRRFCHAIDADDLAEAPRFATLAARNDHRDELKAELTERLSVLTVAECIGRLFAARVICAPVLSVEQVVDDPQVEALGALITLPVGDRTMRVVRSPLHLSATPPTVRRGPPALDEDGPRILAELGYDEAEIAALRGNGAAR